MNPWIVASRIPVYAGLCLLAILVFGRIEKYYIVDSSDSRHPIDVHFWKTGIAIDPAYLVNAKRTMYIPARYYGTFLPLDIVYPVLYSLFFLSLLLYCSKPLLRKILQGVVIAGFVFDWLEDSSFSFFLIDCSNGLAATISFFTTAKTIFFVVNVFVASLLVLYVLYQWLKSP